VLSSLQAFGRNIHRIRAEVGLTQEQLAEKVDISRRFLQELETGEKAPALTTLARLRKALGCDYNNLLRGL
jgi:transcriptional regulator with XRE-family HTH domain